MWYTEEAYLDNDDNYLLETKMPGIRWRVVIDFRMSVKYHYSFQSP